MFYDEHGAPHFLGYGGHNVSIAPRGARRRITGIPLTGAVERAGETTFMLPVSSRAPENDLILRPRGIAERPCCCGGAACLPLRPELLWRSTGTRRIRDSYSTLSN
jgi:hypothetical protein